MHEQAFCILNLPCHAHMDRLISKLCQAIPTLILEPFWRHSPALPVASPDHSSLILSYSRPQDASLGPMPFQSPGNWKIETGEFWIWRSSSPFSVHTLFCNSRIGGPFPPPVLNANNHKLHGGGKAYNLLMETPRAKEVAKISPVLKWSSPVSSFSGLFHPLVCVWRLVGFVCLEKPCALQVNIASGEVCGTLNLFLCQTVSAALTRSL